MDWVRLWLDMPTDPKWRAVARRSGRSVSEVIAVYTHMLCQARRSTIPGTLEAWEDEDVAAALDVETDAIAAIREAMQGKVLDGDRLTGWEKRQPQREREDRSTERVRKHREAKKANKEHGATPVKHHVTPGNPPDTESDSESEGSVTKVTGASNGSAPSDEQDAELFRRGRSVLGKKAGGVIKNLKDQMGSIAKARAVIEQASEKAEPMEYVQGAIRRRIKDQGEIPLSEEFQ